jgi:hypothetical protein
MYLTAYVLGGIMVGVTWEVLFHGEFEAEFDALREDVQDELLAHAGLLRQFGPRLGRPRVDTRKGSRYSNLKELRFDAAGGVWRVAFTFDQNRNRASGSGRQVWYRRKTLLSPANRQGRFAVRFAPGPRNGEAKAEGREETTMKSLEQKVKELDVARRKRIEARAAQVMAEEMSLRELRRAHKLTQERVGRTLGIGQDQVSRLEQRSDLLISTLRGYVEAMGGRLTLIAEFPKRKPVVLSGIAALDADSGI